MPALDALRSRVTVTARRTARCSRPQRIEREFGVDNAVVMRRARDGTYRYIAVGHDGFAVGEPVHIHALFPATYRATEDTWQAAEMRHSRLFGGHVGDTEYDQFLQINTPLKHNGEVVAIQRHCGHDRRDQGDGMLAFFGAPLAGGDDPVRAVACAVEMQRALEDFNGDQRRLGLPELAMGIGVHTGHVVVGNICA